jgi:seryl-tRNA synthetase
MSDKSQLKAKVDNRSDDNKSVDHLISNKVQKKEQKSVVIKKEPKNWDKIVRELEAQDKEEEQSIDNLFQKLYSSADDDTRRAMQKSFYESNGTTLLMDWKSVGKKFVKPYDERDSDEDLDQHFHKDCH